MNARQVFVYAYDFTILGGSLGEMAGRKVSKLMDHAMKSGAPLLGIIDSGGARIQEGVMNSRRQGSHVSVVGAHDDPTMRLSRLVEADIIAAVKGQNCAVL